MRHLQVFPFKSLDGQAVERAALLPSGALEGDRAFALANAAGELVTAKQFAVVHRLRSHLHAHRTHLDLQDDRPGGLDRQRFDLAHERAAVTEWLTAFFGFAVTLQENREVGFPDDLDSPGPTVISTATLTEIGRWFGLPTAEVRARLRTNVEIDGVPPFWEDRLFGAAGTATAFTIGKVAFLGTNPCLRCIVPSRHPSTGEPNTSFPRIFAERRRASLPTWARADRFDRFYRVAINTRLDGWRAGAAIRVGDSVVAAPIA